MKWWWGFLGAGLNLGYGTVSAAEGYAWMAFASGTVGGALLMGAYFGYLKKRFGPDALLGFKIKGPPQ